MKPNDDPEGAGGAPDTQWARVAADLRTYREAQRRAWGDLDEAAIARYLGDETTTAEERSRVEQAMRDFPRVRECVEVLRAVMTEVDLGPEAGKKRAGEGPSRPINQAPSKWGLFSRSSVRRLALYALAACLLVAAALPLFIHKRPSRDIPLAREQSAAAKRELQITSQARGKSAEAEPQIVAKPREKPAEAEPQIVAMKIEQYRDEGDETKPKGMLGVDSPLAREKDVVRVSARLDRPAYCYVIAFTPDGHDQLYYPPDRDVPPPKSAEIHYEGDDGYLPLTNGAGLQAFVVVASNEPLPAYERWRAGLGDVPWQPTQADGVWRSGSRGLELAMAGTTRSGSPEQGRPVQPSQPPPPLARLHRFLETRPGVAAVGVLAFPVEPGRPQGTPPKTDRGGR
jgi:hypothetical protein